MGQSVAAVNSQPSDSRTLGQRIGRAREQAGLSQVEAANAAGAGRTTFARWERDEAVPRGRSLRRLAEALGTTYEWLRDGGAERPPQAVAVPTAHVEASVQAQGVHTGYPAALERLRRATAAVQGALVELEALAAGISPAAAEAAGRAVQGVAVADLLRRTADALEHRSPPGAPPATRAQG